MMNSGIDRASTTVRQKVRSTYRRVVRCVLQFSHLLYASRKGRTFLVSMAIAYLVVLHAMLFLPTEENNSTIRPSPPPATSFISPTSIIHPTLPTESKEGNKLRLASPIAEARAKDTLQVVEVTELQPDEQGLGGAINDYEQAFQVDQSPPPKEQSATTILESVTEKETLVPIGGTKPTAALAVDLQSLVGSPVVLTKSSVSVGDSLSRIFKRNNLRPQLAFELLNTAGTKAVSVLHPGDLFKFVWSDDTFLGIELRRQGKIVLMATFAGGQFSVIDTEAAQRVGSLVKLLERKAELAERKNLFDFEEQYSQLKNAKLVWHNVTVKRSDTLSRIFQRVGLTTSTALAIANSPNNHWFATNLKPGQQLDIAVFEDGQFAILEAPETATAKVRLVFPFEDGYFAGYKKVQTEKQDHYACAEVKNSLFAAGRAIGIPNEVINKYVTLFDSRIDFSRQLRRGDQFCIIYERSYVKGQPLRDIRIKAASLIQNKYEVRAFEHIDDDGQIAYYDSQGINMKGHFLRSPLKYARVTSTYSKNRFHPILKKHRPHLGVDYGAKTGTPIRATGAGKVVKRAYYRGYGKMIVLQHGSRYRTLYAHMSRFAENTALGNFVKQGQVIGYVGSTGLSTGPHLHYEFHVNGKHKDPLTYDMPKGEPILDEYREAFQMVVDEYSQRLASIDAPRVEYQSPAVQTASAR